MSFGFQVETQTVETASTLPIAGSDSAALVAIDDAALDDINGGTGSSTQGYTRNRKSLVQMSGAGPDGAFSMRAEKSEDISSFSHDTFD